VADVTFTDEQQKQVDKLVGDARVKAREKAQADNVAQTAKDKVAAEQAALITEKKWQDLYEASDARVKVLEPLEAQVKAFEEAAKETLKGVIKDLGDTAKTAVATLPKSMTATEKLTWLSKNKGPFQAKSAGVGTAKVAAKVQQDKPKTRGRGSKSFTPRL
jgi:hypothetical protein